MILACSILFMLLSAAAEYVILKSGIPGMPKKWMRTAYTTATALVWIAFFGGIVLTVITTNFDPGIIARAVGASLVLFLWNGLCKIIGAIAVLANRKKRNRTANVTAAILIFAATATILYGTTAGRRNIRTETIRIETDKLSQDSEGLRVALFSDMHTGVLPDRYDMIEEMVGKINSMDADIVINCGDIANYDYRELDERIVGTLSRIESRYGVYAVLGNHDLGIYIRDTVYLPPQQNIDTLTALQWNIGWHVLRNETVTIPAGHDTITITGLDYPAELVHRSHHRLSDTTDFSTAYAGVRDDLFNLTVSHAPQAWNDVKELGYGDLTVSGHVHSMQMKITLGKWLRWSPAALLYDQWSGRYDDNGHTLYVNDGIGCAMLPMRIGTRPEITLLEIVPAKREATKRRDNSDYTTP